MKKFKKPLFLASSICIASSTALANGGDTSDGEKVGYLVPDSPALSLIGVAADKTLRPQSPKALVTDLRTAFDDNGKLKNTISLAFVPYLVLEGGSARLDRYNSEFGIRALANTEISLVAAAGESTNDADRYSAGLRWNIFDDGDPRSASLDCVINAVQIGRNALRDAGIVDHPERAEEIREMVRVHLKETCYKDWRKDFWNAQALDIGLAYAWADGGTNLSGLEENSFGAYASWSFPVSGRDGQVITHARYTVDQLAVSKAGGFFNQDAGYVGARWRHKLGERSAINLEAGYTFTDPTNMPSDSYAQYGVSLEYRLSQDLWFVASTGGRSNADNEDDDVRGLAAIKWNLANAASIFD